MDRLASQEVVIMFLGLGILLASARLCGELVRRLNQPSVVGEILAGILLGPTFFGAFAPASSSILFPLQGPNAIFLDGLTTLAISLFLLVAGMEVDLSTIWRQGRTAISVGAAGVVFPFALGFSAAWLAPRFFYHPSGADLFLFSLFIATALSITALPVIIKILMDLNLYRTDIGMIIVAAAILGDLVGWNVFAMILGMMEKGGAYWSSLTTVLMTVGFAGVMLSGGRWVIHRSLPWIQAHTAWPGGILGLALSLGLLGAAFSEWIGTHAIFGSFLVGVAIGDSSHLREQTRSVLGQFVSFIFAPIFFASIGLRMDFSTHFDGWLILVLLMVTSVGKILGCGLGARLSGMPWRESLVIGSGMIAQGTMGIILGLLALQKKVIGEHMFVAIVVTSLVTSMLSGPLMQRILRRKKVCLMMDYLSGRSFLGRLRAATRFEAIAELSRAVGAATGLDEIRVEKAVLAREEIMPTGLGNGVAVPHARLADLEGPLVCLGLSEHGIDFDAPDGEPATIVVLILSPLDDDCAHIEIFADIARTFRDKEVRQRVLRAENYTEFMAVVNTVKTEQ